MVHQHEGVDLHVGEPVVPKDFLTDMANTEVLLLHVGEPFVPKGLLTGMVNTEVLLLHWTILDILIDFLAPKDF
jgi:hypothetical protein